MADPLAEQCRTSVTAWVLAGGEGRRVQGQDKGLLPYRGQPLASWVMQALAPQCQTLRVSANRHLDSYRALWRAHALTPPPPMQASPPVGEAAQAVWPDDADLPARSGPLAGIVTALRHTDTAWLLVAPCDTPHLPADLAVRLMASALHTNADIVIPCTQSDTPEARHHWVCGLIRKRVCPDTVQQFVNGERKVGQWVQSQSWTSVSFDNTDAFANMNSLETLRDRD